MILVSKYYNSVDGIIREVTSQDDSHDIRNSGEHDQDFAPCGSEGGISYIIHKLLTMESDVETQENMFEVFKSFTFDICRANHPGYKLFYDVDYE